MSWAATEFESLDLGDPRRNRRAIRLMDKLSAKSTASIPGACGNWADTIGAPHLVARLGGFLARKGDGEPGVKTLWLGMQRILDFAAGIRFSRELQARGTCV